MIAFLLLVLISASQLKAEVPFTFQGRSELKSDLFFAMTPVESRGHCTLYRLSPDNKVLFQRKLDLPCMDFRPHVVPEGQFYSYFEPSEGIPGSAPFGKRIILDSGYKIVKRIPEEFAALDFVLLGPDHWVGIEYDLRTFSSGKTYLNRIVRERKDGKIVFEWGAHDFILQSGSDTAAWATVKPFAGSVVIDYMVFNSLQILKDEILLGTGTNGVLLIDRKTGKIQWIFGGLSDQFSLDHRQNNLFTSSVRFDSENSELLLLSHRSFDIIGTDHTKIRKYQIDVPGRRLLKVEELRDRKEYFGHLGSLVSTGDILSVGTGRKNRAAYDFLELSEGKENWKILFGKKFFSSGFYRSPESGGP